MIPTIRFHVWAKEQQVLSIVFMLPRVQSNTSESMAGRITVCSCKKQLHHIILE